MWLNNWENLCVYLEVTKNFVCPSSTSRIFDHLLLLLFLFWRCKFYKIHIYLCSLLGVFWLEKLISSFIQELSRLLFLVPMWFMCSWSNAFIIKVNFYFILFTNKENWYDIPFSYGNFLRLKIWSIFKKALWILNTP